jgi:LPS export ABC transporter protein LptC
MNIKIFVFAVLALLAIPVFAEDTPPTQQLEGFNLNGYTPTGKKSWEINGDKADISDAQIKVNNVNANFYNPKENANLTSKTGTINKTTGDVHLQDDVVITADRGTKMTTDSLDWNRNKDLVTTNDPVKIVDKQGTVTGTGLTGHPNLKQAQLNQDVKAVVSTAKDTASAAVKAAQTMQITCDGPMQMDQVKMYAVFNKHVVAVEASTGRELHADLMRVWFDDKSKKIKKVICTGNVSILQGENASYADEMVYNGDDETLVMNGRPKLVFDTGGSKGQGLFQKIGQ